MKQQPRNRRFRVPKELVLLAIAVVLTTVNLVVVGVPFNPTAALLNDPQAVPSNQFSTGTFDAVLTDANEADQQSVFATWTGSGMRPGDSITATLSVKNVGTVQGNHIEISTANIMTESGSVPGSTATVPMDRVLEITALNYDGVNKVALITDVNGNGIKDLDDLETSALDGLALTDFNVAHTIEMTVSLSFTLSTNEHHGDSVTSVVTITFNQDASQ